MRKAAWIPLLASICLVLPALGRAQENEEEDLIKEVAIPVWVFQGDHFVEGLNRADFQVLQNGVERQVDGLYLIKGSRIIRREENFPFSPRLQRNFFLLFQTYDYDIRFEEAIEYLLRFVGRTRGHADHPLAEQHLPAQRKAVAGQDGDAHHRR